MTSDTEGREPAVAPDPFAGPEWEEAPLSGAAVEPGTKRVKRSRRRSRRLRRMRRAGWVMIGLGGLIVLCGVYLAVTALMARSHLEQARTDVAKLRSQLSSGNLVAARATAHRLASEASSAHDLTTGPVWYLAAGIPSGGEPLATIRGITASVDRLASDAVPRLLSAGASIDPKQLRGANGAVDLAPIAAAVPALDHAQAGIAAAAKAVAGLPAHTWLGTVDAARADLLAQLGRLGDTVGTADTAAHVVPPMLGANGPRTYLLVFQNDAEARGTGGLPGAFALVTASAGRLHFDKFYSDSEIFGVHADVSFGPQYDQLFGGAGTTTLFGNANLSPNFPYAAEIWASMWRAKTGQQVDGVIAIDPTALSYLLGTTGPVTAKNGTVISAANVVALTQSTVYAKYPAPAQNDQRKEFLLEIARAVSGKLAGLPADPKPLLHAAGKAAGERRILVWSADPALESRLAQTPVGGTIPRTSAPYVGLSIVNDGGNKLDYYLDRALTWQRSGCGAMRQVTVTIRLTNNAPASGLSYNVINRSDAHSYPVKPGDNRLMVSYYATAGALMHAVRIDGRPTTATVGSQFGHPVFVMDVEVPRGRTTTVTLSLTEPVGTGSPIVLRQPLVRPLQVTLHDQHCG